MRTHAKIDPPTNGFAAAKNLLVAFTAIFICASSSFATTKGLSQIVTPDLQEEGDLSLSLQIQDERIGNPYELQAELGLTKWAEIAVFQGFKPNEEIFATEFGILTKEPYLLSIGFTNWSPRSYKNEAILGYAYDFNKQWRVQVDFQSGRENSSTIGFTWNITPDFQVNPALYFANYHPDRLMGYVVFTYTFHVWGNKKEEPSVSPK